MVSLPYQQQWLQCSKSKDTLLPKISKELRDAMEAELQAANLCCEELKNKLILAEEQAIASVLFSKNAANELSLFSLQQRLNTILATPDGVDAQKALADVKSAVLASRCSSVDGLQAHVMKLSKVSIPTVTSETSSLEMTSSSNQESLVDKCDEYIFNIKPKLRLAIAKVVQLVEELVVAECHKPQQLKAFCSENQWQLDGGCGHPGMLVSSKQRASDLDAIVTKFKSTGNQVLEGKMELLVQLMRELSSVLCHIRNMGLSTSHISLNSRERHKQEATEAAEQEVFSDAESSFSIAGSEHQLGPKVLLLGERVSNLRETRAGEELRKIPTEKAALESHMKAEFSRMDMVEEMVAKLQCEKSELSNMLEEEKEKLETIKSQLLDAEQLVASLRMQLALTEASRNVAEERLSSATAENAKLVFQLQESQAELSKMHEKLNALDKSPDQEHARNKELQDKVEASQEHLQRIFKKEIVESLHEIGQLVEALEMPALPSEADWLIFENNVEEVAE